MTRFRRDEDGMAMITIILALTIMIALAVAAIQYGLGSQNVSKRDQDWQSALSAAEAGLDNYQFHVNENANYIAYSASNPPPDGNLAFSQYVAIPGGNTSGQYRYTARRVEGRHRRHHHGHEHGQGRRDEADGAVDRAPAQLPRLPLLHRLRDPGPGVVHRQPLHRVTGAERLRAPLLRRPQQQLQRHPVHLGRHAQRARALERRHPHVRVTGLQEHRVDELEHQRHPLPVGLWRHASGLRQPGRPAVHRAALDAAEQLGTQDGDHHGCRRVPLHGADPHQAPVRAAR